MKQQIVRTFCDRCGKEGETKQITQRNASGDTQTDPPSGRTEWKMDIIDLCHTCCATFLQKSLEAANIDTPLDTLKWAHKPRTEFW